MSAGIMTRFKEAGQSAMSAHRPWSEFFDLSALSLPPNSSESTTRLLQNLTHFRSNYAMAVLVVLFLSLVYHPLSLLVFLAVFAAWVLLYFSREDDLEVFGLPVPERVVMAVLGVVTVVALVLTHVWLNVVVSGAVGVVLVGVHAVFRGTEDLVMEDKESPYGALLSEDDPDSHGNYTIM
ncbi:PRA1 family protein D-like [Argentina anserina]|uniref:PRA1 family protein D-like n=1 Tax=Argentina anserina TaxID=57926 RepID=UPI0021768AD3|nr:PRA1 family protein D-like [Potentilla anserina]